MTFFEYWDSLFADKSVGFVKDREGKTFPVRLSDRKIAEHFWYKSIEETEEAMRDHKLPR